MIAHEGAILAPSFQNSAPLHQQLKFAVPETLEKVRLSDGQVVCFKSSNKSTSRPRASQYSTISILPFPNCCVLVRVDYPHHIIANSLPLSCTGQTSISPERLLQCPPSYHPCRCRCKRALPASTLSPNAGVCHDAFPSTTPPPGPGFDFDDTGPGHHRTALAKETWPRRSRSGNIVVQVV